MTLYMIIGVSSWGTVQIADMHTPYGIAPAMFTDEATARDGLRRAGGTGTLVALELRVIEEAKRG